MHFSQYERPQPGPKIGVNSPGGPCLYLQWLLQYNLSVLKCSGARRKIRIKQIRIIESFMFCLWDKRETCTGKFE